ncbi:MAG: IclR family transcriptional regulator [Betaproteobacteria bacterium]|nr:IclR family transcriptional regulator [Betaproteobacteria bacterium]MDE2209440.1 IclR family transcriptional regulator [Betaproteobacteria bacterium]MDE2358765.1 IclR family transcriptional regulator [Betaproteobacteria bacterium]
MTEPETSKNVVQSLAKGFSVMEAFTSDEPELVLAEIARRAGLDNGTTFRLLNTLVMLGYVERVEGSRRFRLTLKCLELGFNAIARSDLRTRARPVLRGLVGEMNEAASIGVLEGAEVVYIERMQAGMTRLGVDVRIGSRVPVHSTAIGHAIVSFLPRDDQERILAAAPRRKVTDKTVTGVRSLLQRFKEVRARGYAVSDQENVPGLCVLAAPIVGADGLPIAGLSVAAPAFRMSAQAFAKAGAGPLLEAARVLSRGLNAAGGFALHSTHA